MTLPNDKFDPNLVTNSTLANQIDDKIMDVLTLLADVLGVDLGAKRTVQEAMAVFNTSTGLFNQIKVKGANSDFPGYVLEDSTNSERWRISVDGSGGNDQLLIERYNGATWDSWVSIDENRVYHEVTGALGGVTDVLAGTGISVSGTGDITVGIANGGVDTAQIAAGAITNTEVDAAAAISGTKLALVSVQAGGGNETNNRIYADPAKVNLPLVADGDGGAEWAAIGKTGIGNGAVGTDELEIGAVNAAALATNAVETIKIKDLAVTEAKIGSLAVTEGKIGTGAVTVNKLGANAVSLAKFVRTGTAGYPLLSNGTLSDASYGLLNGSNISANTVALSKISRTGTSGQPLLSGGTGADPAYAKLPATAMIGTGGTAGYVLTCDTPTTSPTWQPAPSSGGDFFMIYLGANKLVQSNTLLSWGAVYEQEGTSISLSYPGGEDSSITPGIAGVWVIGAKIHFESISDGHYINVRLYVSGGERSIQMAHCGTAYNNSVSTSIVTRLTAVNYISVYSSCSESGGKNALSGATYTQLYGYRIAD